MNISLVYESNEQQNATAMLLADAGFIVNQTFPLASQWAYNTRQQPPAILVIVVTIPEPNLLQQLKILGEQPKCPVIVITSLIETDQMRAIMLAGANSCINMKALNHQIQGVIEAATIHYEIMEALHKTILDLNEQIESLESRLQDRRDIDHAKGLLMTTYKMNETDAYNAMRNMAMDSGNMLGEVARNLISMSKVLN